MQWLVIWLYRLEHSRIVSVNLLSFKIHLIMNARALLCMPLTAEFEYSCYSYTLLDITLSLCYSIMSTQGYSCIDKTTQEVNN